VRISNALVRAKLFHASAEDAQFLVDLSLGVFLLLVERLELVLQPLAGVFQIAPHPIILASRNMDTLHEQLRAGLITKTDPGYLTGCGHGTAAEKRPFISSSLFVTHSIIRGICPSGFSMSSTRALALRGNSTNSPAFVAESKQ